MHLQRREAGNVKVETLLDGWQKPVSALLGISLTMMNPLSSLAATLQNVRAAL